jgi:peptide/nickel transport system permease protein
MSRYILRRLLLMIPLLVGITILTFGIVNLVPGSPVASLRAELRGSRQMRQRDIERIERHLGLDRPVYVRYLVWIGNVARGDLGISMRNYASVTGMIRARLPNTLLLTTSAFLLSFLLSIPIGVYAAIKRNSWFDNTSTAVAVAGYSVPTFWLALMLVLLLAVKFKEWGLPSLPAGGAYDLRGGGGLFDRIEHLILPAFTLAFVQAAYWMRFVRSQMLEVLSQDYMRTARAKGLDDRLVIYRHGLRNACLPLVTLLGLTIPELFAGALIIEQIFSYPGMGELAFSAALDKDYPLIMGTVLVASVLVLVGNLLADVVYSLVDPRIRLSS